MSDAAAIDPRAMLLWLAIAASWVFLSLTHRGGALTFAEEADTASWAWDTDESSLANRAHAAAEVRKRAWAAGVPLPARTSDEWLIRAKQDSVLNTAGRP